MDTFLYLQWHNACQMASFHKADSVESDKITLTKDGIDSVQEHQNSRVCCGGMHGLCCVICDAVRNFCLLYILVQRVHQYLAMLSSENCAQ